MAETTLTWLGHAAFRLDTAGGKRIYVDPWLKAIRSAPRTSRRPSAWTSSPSRTLTATTSATPSTSRRSTAPRSSRRSSSRAGSAGRASTRANSSRRTKAAPSTSTASKFTLTNAFHSGSAPDGSYVGEACGIVRHDERRQDALLRRRHVRVWRHAADRPHLPARRCDAPDRRPLHDGPARGCRRRRAARREARRARATGGRSRS